MRGNHAAQKRKRPNVNEETTKIKKTEALAGAGSLQRETRSEKSILQEFAVYQKEEADQFAQRGYGGYIDSADLAELRKQQETLVKELQPTHQARVVWEKACARRN